MERKFGIFAECLRGVSSVDALPLIRNAGFTCYATGLFELEDVKRLTDAGDKLGFKCDFIHAPFVGKEFFNNDIWRDGIKYDMHLLQYYKRSIDSASACGIPKIIIHLISCLGRYSCEFSDIGMRRLDELVAYAADKGVILAFENQLRVGLMAYIADRYESHPNVGFCYDMGHEHCMSGYRYDKDMSWMDIYRDKLVTTHIHDNPGMADDPSAPEQDFHLLPFEGNIDYSKPMAKLDKYGYTGPLILEVSNSGHLEMPHEEFLALCYSRLDKLSKM